ncbi:MAG: hypothetical protein E7158_02645 [Firmicutes bacterium]|nr:hypothetical protein [Bacillota bacterium]
MEKTELLIINSFNNLAKKVVSEKNNAAALAHFIGINNIQDLCLELPISFKKLNISKLNSSTILKLNQEYNKFLYRNYQDCNNCFNFTANLMKNISEYLQKFDYNDNIENKRIKLVDLITIAYDFLKWYNKDYKETLINLNNNGRLIFKDCKNSFTSKHGITYFSYEPNDIYIVINNLKTLITSSCIAHEITHAYYINLDNNCSYKKRIRRDYNLTGEIASYTTELFFIDYLFEKNFSYEDIFLLINDYDYYLFMLTSCWKLFFETKHKMTSIDYKNEQKEFEDDISDFFGKAMAYYLHSLNDKEKVFYLLDRIHIESKEKNLLEILNNNNIDIDYIESFDYAKKLINKHWRC